MMAFLDTNNVLYWRQIVQCVRVGTTDIAVGILDAEVPPSVGFLPVLPPDYSTYLPTNSSIYVQGIGMNQDMRIFSQPTTFEGLFPVDWSSGGVIPFGLGTNWSVTVRPGDSSDPERFLINNGLVLVSHNESAVGGPNYAFQLDAINQNMHYLSTNNNAGTDYQLTLFSLTNWPAIANH
jgi:hypothetical protein